MWRTIVVLVSSWVLLHAQTISNGTFEQWGKDTLYYYPSGWSKWITMSAAGTYLNMPLGNVRPYAPGLDGILSISLESYQFGSDTIGGVAVVRQDNFSYNGFGITIAFKALYMTTAADTAQFQFVVTDPTKEIVAFVEASIQHGGADTTDTVVTVPLTIFIPSVTNGYMYIIMASGEVPGSKLIVDSLVFSAGVGASVSPAMDGGFEQWAPVSYDYPTNWATIFPTSYLSNDTLTFGGNPVGTLPLVDSVVTSLRPTTDAYEGNQAVRFEPRRYNVGGSPAMFAVLSYGHLSTTIFPPPFIPYNGPANKKTDSLIMYIKSSNFNPNTDSLTVIVTLKNPNKTQSFQGYIPPGITAYTPFVVDLSSYNDRPDSIGILFLAQAPTTSTGMWVQIDSVDFVLNPIVSTTKKIGEQLPYLYLKQQTLMLSHYPEKTEQLTIVLYDLQGREVVRKTLKAPTLEVGTALVPPGIYIYHIVDTKTQEVLASQKFVWW